MKDTNMNQKTAIILGATGLTGSLLLKRLINDDTYKTIKLFSRRKTNIQSSKIQEFIGDLLQLDQFKTDFIGDEVFCCIGTTKKKTQDKTDYVHIDVGIPEAAAKLAKANNISTFVIISAMGASTNSSIFYNHVKGKAEDVVLSQDIENTFILRPSLIVGDRKENRTGEAFGVMLMKILNPLMFGPFRKYKSINADIIANAMQNVVKTKKEKQVFLSDEIEILARTINS